MKWSETKASKCSYGEIAERIFEKANIIAEDSEIDYSGYANILAEMPDGTFIHYEWSYGSCSGCDEWESRDLTNDQIEEEMRREMTIFHDERSFYNYVNKLPAFKENKRIKLGGNI